MKNAIWILSALVILGCVLKFQSSEIESDRFKRHMIKNYDEVGQSASSQNVQINPSHVY